MTQMPATASAARDAWSREVAATHAPAARRRLAGLVLLGMSLRVVGPAWPPATAFEQDQVECEEAVAHLVECCPELRPEWFFCERLEPFSGCGDAREPDIDLEKSRVIRGRSCAELRDADWCSWARKVAAQEPSGQGSDGL